MQDIQHKRAHIHGTWTGEINANIYIRALDRAGNISEVSSINLKIDQLPPRIEVALSGVGGYNSIYLNIGTRDLCSGIYRIRWYYKKQEDSEYSYKDVYYDVDEEKLKTMTIDRLLENKTYNIYAEIYDKMKNKSTSDVISVRTVDKFLNYSPTSWTNGSVRISLKVVDGMVPVYTLDGTIPTASSKKYFGEFDVYNNCKITYAYMDGTTVKYSGVVNITNIDKEPPTNPTIKVSKLGDGMAYTEGTWTNSAIRIMAESMDELSKIRVIQYSYDKQNWGDNWGSSIKTDGNKVSIHGDWKGYYDKIVYVRAIDKTANVSDINSVSIKVDEIKPIISKELETISVGRNQVTFSIGVTDKESGIGKIEWCEMLDASMIKNKWTTTLSDLYTNTSGPTTEQIKTFSFTRLEPGIYHNFKVIIYDVAGNKVETEMVSIKTDS